MSPLKFSDIIITWAAISFGVLLPLPFMDVIPPERLASALRTCFDMGWALGFLYVAKRWLLK